MIPVFQKFSHRSVRISSQCYPFLFCPVGSFKIGVLGGPRMIDGKKVYPIGLPIHQGYRGIAEDEGKDARTLANLLTPTVVDPNAYTPEFKGFLVKVEKA